MHPLSLTTLVDEQLGAVRTAGNGRSARTVHGDHEHALRQTLIALFAGSELADHSSPGEAALQVLRGRVRLTTATTAGRPWQATPRHPRRTARPDRGR
jgi:quercetin dioxygenase-like cupin family protein